jgi:hypothetical protein
MSAVAANEVTSAITAPPRQSRHVVSAEAAHVRSGEVTAAEATHVTSAEMAAAEAAHMAAAAHVATTTSVTTATAAARLCIGGHKAAGQRCACQDHKDSSSHHILL